MVPKIIHQIVGKKPSELVKMCLESWKVTIRHGFKIVYWDDDSLAKFIKDKYEFALDAFLNARNHAEAADIARYLVIYHYGGYYVDWDISLNNAEDFLSLADKEQKGYVVIDPLNETLASEHFSALASDTYLYTIVEDIITTYIKDERDLMATPNYSGPYRMRATMRKFQNIEQSKIQVKDIFEYAYDEIRNHKVFMQSGIMTHYWEHSWFL
nr:glycosyltransferase [uncultured Sphingobacterium sp.]